MVTNVCTPSTSRQKQENPGWIMGQSLICAVGNNHKNHASNIVEDEEQYLKLSSTCRWPLQVPAFVHTYRHTHHTYIHIQTCTMKQYKKKIRLKTKIKKKQILRSWISSCLFTKKGWASKPQKCFYLGVSFQR